MMLNTTAPSNARNLMRSISCTMYFAWRWSIAATTMRVRAAIPRLTGGLLGGRRGAGGQEGLGLGQRGND